MCLPQRSLLLLLALLTTLALFASACGDDSGESGPVDDDDPATGEADADGSDGDTDDGDVAAGDAGDMDDGDMDDGDMGDGDSVDDSSPFCSLSGQANEAGDAFDPLGASPQEVESYFRSQLALAEQAVEVATDDIRDAMVTQRQALVDTVAILEPLGWDLASNFDAVTPLYDTAEWDAAAAALEEFDEVVCGFAPDDDDPADETGAPDPLLSPEEDAYCAQAVVMASLPDLPFDGTPTEVMAYYDRLVDDLALAESLAPGDVVVDYEVVGDVFADVYLIMETAGWDLAVAQPLLDEFRADLEIGIAMESAIGRIEDYDAEVCGLL